MTILGHHGGLTSIDPLREARAQPVEDEAETVATFLEHIPEAKDVIDGPVLVPEAWRHDALLLKFFDIEARFP